MIIRCGEDQQMSFQYWSVYFLNAPSVSTMELLDRYSDEVYRNLVVHAINKINEFTLTELRFVPLFDKNNPLAFRGEEEDPHPFYIRKSDMKPIQLRVWHVIGEDGERKKFITNWQPYRSNHGIDKWDTKWLDEQFHNSFQRLDYSKLLKQLKQENRRQVIKACKSDVDKIRKKLSVIQKYTLKEFGG